MKYYVSARHFLYKCFTFDAPFVQGMVLSEMELTISASLFKGGKVTSSSPNGEYFITYGYPNQFILTAVRNMVNMKGSKMSTSCLAVNTILGTVEVLRRRDKRGQRCNEDWKNHDKYVMGDIVSKVGCKPRHWKMDMEVKNCSTLRQHRSISKLLEIPETSMPPCRSIELLSKTVNEIDNDIACTMGKPPPYFGELVLSVDFTQQTMYKEVTLVRVYSIQALVGNAGIMKNYQYAMAMIFTLSV